MRIDLIMADELGPAERTQWRRFQAAERSIAIPSLSPGWASAVSQARPDARIAVMREGSGRILGFLPLQATAVGAVQPLGASLKLGCGLVGDPQLAWGAAEWLRDIKARSFDFEGAPENQAEFARAARGSVLRMTAELYGGAGAYLEMKRADDFDVLERRARRIDALAAHAGGARVKLFSCASRDFDAALYWSAGAYRRPQHDWEIAALRAAFEAEDESFEGALFTVHAGQTLAAGAFFIADDRRAQLVFYGENPELEAHEPAAIVLADAIAAFAARGLVEVDFGAVEGPLSREFATRRLQRLYGLIRPAAKKRRFGPLNGRARRAARDWREAEAEAV